MKKEVNFKLVAADSAHYSLYMMKLMECALESFPQLIVQTYYISQYSSWNFDPVL